MTSGHTKRGLLFRLFEVGCAIWAQGSQIGVSQIKAHTGKVNEKYVHIFFLVKMSINLRSCGLFGSIWVGDSV